MSGKNDVKINERIENSLKVSYSLNKSFVRQKNMFLKIQKPRYIKPYLDLY